MNVRLVKIYSRFSKECSMIAVIDECRFHITSGMKQTWDEIKEQQGIVDSIAVDQREIGVIPLRLS